MKKIRDWSSHCLVLLAALTFSQLFFVNKVLAVEAVDQCFCMTNTNSACFNVKQNESELCNAMGQSSHYLSCRLMTIDRAFFGESDVTTTKKNQLLLEECRFEKEQWDDSHKPKVSDQDQDTNDTDSFVDLKTRTQSKLNPLQWLTGNTPTKRVNTFIGRIIFLLMFAIGSLLLLFYVWAGFLWMTARGNSEQITKAKHIIVWSTLSIVVQFAAYWLVQSLFSLF